MIALLCAAAILEQPAPQSGIEDWRRDHESRIAWWREARFGMFITWGLYSVAGGRWNGKDYKQPYAEWIQNWAGVDSKAYAAALRPGFAPKELCFRDWARLAKEAGMKYAVLVAKHHDGFTLFNSREPYSLSNEAAGSTNISPPERDLVREYCDAFRQQGLRIGLYYSLLDWQHPDAYEIALPTPAHAIKRNHPNYLRYYRSHVNELLSNYGKVDVLWFDYSTKQFEGDAWQASGLLRDIRKRQPRILINNRLWNGLENQNGDFGTPEKYVPETGIPGFDWETNHTLNESFGFSYHDGNWKSAKQVIRLLAEVASKGGNLLLNIGPDATGTLPKEAVETLRGVGRWMKANSDSIYGTTSAAYSQVKGALTTRKANRIYLHVFEWPTDRTLDLPKGAIHASLLAGGKKLTIRGGKIILPALQPDPADTVIVCRLQAK
jgi:alpha-L-fucosidase